MPDDATVTDHLGDVYAKLGDKEAAQEQWRRALRLLENQRTDAGGDVAEEEAKLMADLKTKLAGEGF